VYNIPRDAHIHYEILPISLKLQRKLHNSALKVPQQEWVQKQTYECNSQSVRLPPSSWKIPLWNYETLMNELFWTHIRVFRIYTFDQSSEGRGHLLPLYSVLQFLLNQTNSFKHISDIIDSPFLYLESFPTLELFDVRCQTLHHKWVGCSSPTSVTFFSLYVSIHTGSSPSTEWGQSFQSNFRKRSL
jgi:hypothetical protein